MSRKANLIRVAGLTSEVFDLVDVASGWPGFGVLRSTTGEHRVAVYVGPIGSSQRGRDEVERRFQNPGSDRPIVLDPNRQLLLLGLWEEEGEPVLVGMDEQPRLESVTRFSMFMPLSLLRRAAKSGWAEHESESGERIIAFQPHLLPVYFEVRYMDIPGLGKAGEDQLDLLDAIESLESQTTVERRKTTVKRLVRAATFRRDVLKAYDYLCAFCDLNWGLIEGAHVMPAQAKGPDKVWNGLALCSNYHNAFDRHLIHIEPGSGAILLHPRFSEPAASDSSKAFVETTRSVVRPPAPNVLAVRDEMLLGRYDFYSEKYDWAR